MKAALGMLSPSEFSPPPSDTNRHTCDSQQPNMDAEIQGHSPSYHNSGKNEYYTRYGAECRLNSGRKPVVPVDLV